MRLLYGLYKLPKECCVDRRDIFIFLLHLQFSQTLPCLLALQQQQQLYVYTTYIIHSYRHRHCGCHCESSEREKVGAENNEMVKLIKITWPVLNT